MVIPTGQGGGADRLARGSDDAWSKQLGGRRFEYTFVPGASGQVGHELFVNRRDKDGYHLLFGNMGPEMLMYALQRPRFRSPEHLPYFCRIDIDESCVFVCANSPFRCIEDVVTEAKRRPLNVATSRIPHPASIGIFGTRFPMGPFDYTLVALFGRSFAFTQHHGGT